MFNPFTTLYQCHPHLQESMSYQDTGVSYQNMTQTTHLLRNLHSKINCFFVLLLFLSS